MPAVAKDPIDRAALVRRHNPINRSIDVWAPLTVGNGEFAFTADVTGLQTFADEYEAGICLCTMSQWGWHTAPPPQYPPLQLEQFDTRGRAVGYATNRSRQEAQFDYLRQNPHRLHLGRIAFTIWRHDGTIAKSRDLHDIHQTLDLWSGILLSQFAIDGASLRVRTACHPTRDVLCVEVEGELLRQSRVQITIDFPAPSPQITAANWNDVQSHRTMITSQDSNGAILYRTIDADSYFVRVDASHARISQSREHAFVIDPRSSQDRFTCCFEFFARQVSDAISASDVLEASARHWSKFWTGGAAVEISGRGERISASGTELERRVVLSQYLTAVQCGGSLPPQETGLTCNSWYGKFHLEMHWWHAAHFALWNRIELLERSLGWYEKCLPAAIELARSQGYPGARWPKMVGPEGRDSPSSIGPLLIWQQPHPIHFAELCYQSHQDDATLARFTPIVEATAEFMAAFAHWDGARYVLGPPLIPAQECNDPRTTINPTFELAYWKQGLQWAQQWRRRREQAENDRWRHVIDHLAPLPTRDGVYQAHEACPQSFEQFNTDHPSMLAALGMLNGDGVDSETMRRTLHRVVRDWDWSSAWGWDFPLAAMTAARLNEPQLAVDLLLMDTPKNRYLPNGHNFQRNGLPVYLPGNGALLAAIAMMAGGWRGATCEAPGFPQEGSWIVRAEGFLPVL